MAKTGKILAFVAGLLTIIGTFFFTLLQFFTGYVYGAGGMFNIDDIFVYGTSGAPDAWVAWVAGPLIILYLLSGFVQLLGIKSKIAAILGSILPLFVAISILLAWFDVTVPYMVYLLFLAAEPLVPGIIPIAFEYSFMVVGWGTFIILIGGLLSLISGFMSRE